MTTLSAPDVPEPRRPTAGTKPSATRPHTSLNLSLCEQGRIQEKVFGGCARDNVSRECRLRDGSSPPRPADLSHNLLTVLAADRYFRLVRAELWGLRGLFTPAEIRLVINATSALGWSTNAAMRLVDALKEDLILEAEAFTGQTVDIDVYASVGTTAQLFAKLDQLNRSQHLALIDVCERWTRTVFEPAMTFEQQMSELGLQLTDENTPPAEHAD